jgi:hypothetical protein
MSFTMVTGDLFDLGLPAIGHGCDCAGAMGAGVAVEFKRRFPAMHQEYRRRCRQGTFRLGDIFVWDQEPGLVVYNLATQSVPCPGCRSAQHGRRAPTPQASLPQTGQLPPISVRPARRRR